MDDTSCSVQLHSMLCTKDDHYNRSMMHYNAHHYCWLILISFECKNCSKGYYIISILYSTP